MTLLRVAKFILVKDNQEKVNRKESCQRREDGNKVRQKGKF